jgi:hypothetical protein
LVYAGRHLTSKADQVRLDWVHEQPCIACTLNRFVSQVTGMRVEAHHLVDKGYRKHSGGHQATIPLCAWHHRGEPHIDFSIKEMGYRYGPSIAVSKRMFVAQYGTDRELLEKVNLTHSDAASASPS